MNLLVVDDQKVVVAGIVKGIDWGMLGIDTVFTAYNALEAKEILSEHIIEIMLCDIEMPVESGVELLEWIRKEDIATLCIFLTSHSDFAYIQNALRLGGYDYILQPASYSDISKAVRRAILEVGQMEKDQELSQMGQIYKMQEEKILSVTLKQYLEGKEVDGSYIRLEKFGKLPNRNYSSIMILIQILRWRSCEDWENSLLYMTIKNILDELFENNEIKISLAQIDKTVYAVVMQGAEYIESYLEDIERKLTFFDSLCRRRLKFDLAIYINTVSEGEHMPDVWQTLIVMKENNVSLKPGIFQEGMKSDKQYKYRLPYINRWKNLIKNGELSILEIEANHFIDDMVEQDKIDAKILLEFYQDFLQLIYTTSPNTKINVKDMFQKAEEIELYNNGMNSVNSMKKLIHHIVGYYSDYSENLDINDNCVDKAIEYIMQHLDEDIRRDDLAKYVHLSSDYLTKLFKKETGLTTKEFVVNEKMKEAQTLLRSTKLPVGYISSKVGYCNFSYFSQTYKKVMGISPNEERKISDDIK